MKFERLHVVSSMLAAAVAVPTAVFSYWRLNQLTSPVPHMHICNTVYETEDKTGKRTRKPRLHIDFGNAGSASMNVLSLQMFVNGQPATTWQTVIGNGKSHGVPWLPLLPFEPPIVSWTSDWRYFAPNEYTNVACIVPVDGSVDDSYEGAAKWTKVRYFI
jgi:hypothetical protein